MATVIPTNDQLATLKANVDTAYNIADAAKLHYQNLPNDPAAKQAYLDATQTYLDAYNAYVDAQLVSMDGPTNGVVASSATSAGSTTSSTNSASSAGAGVTGAVSGALSSLTSTLPAPLGNAINSALSSLLGAALKTPVPTNLIPNPMHQYASWSYALSLWWLDVTDYNNLVSAGDAGGTSIPLPNSFVVAEDSGLYPHQRLPTQNGLNYNIQTVEFDSIVGLNSTTKSSNMNTGRLTIAEPYGVTFLDSLIRASVGKAENYTGRPYMLQIDFVGYDDAGNPVPTTQTNIYRKRFPIKLNGMKIEVTTRGAEYNIEFVGLNQVAHHDEHAKIPKNLTVTAATVGDFFDPKVAGSFSSQLNDFWKQEVVNNKAQFANSLDFDIDPKIASSKIISDKQMSLGQANPNGSGVDLSKGNFSITAGTPIQEVINKVLIQSQFLQDQLSDPTADETPEQILADNQAVLNTFKTTVQALYSGVNATGATVKGASDQQRNTWAYNFKYCIHQYHVYDAKHPSAPTQTDSRPYSVKEYYYTYTGKNIDILDLKINFDNTFFTAVNAYTAENAATNPTASSSIDQKKADASAPSLTNSLLGALGLIPGFNSIANLTPLRIKNIVNDQRDNIGMNVILNPKAQVGANVMRSIYTQLYNGDMTNLDLKIVGDPTLLKQDDWLYTPSPTTSTNWLSAISQSAFAQKYGHIRMDNGQLMATVTINSITDIDIDQKNAGLVSPAIGSTPSLFSGQYEIKTIKNTFSNGVFEQTLSMVRNMNSDIVASGATVSGRGTVALSQGIQGLVNKAVQSVGGLISSALGSTTASASAPIDQSTATYDATRTGGISTDEQL